MNVRTHGLKARTLQLPVCLWPFAVEVIGVLCSAVRYTLGGYTPRVYLPNLCSVNVKRTNRQMVLFLYVPTYAHANTYFSCQNLLLSVDRYMAQAMLARCFVPLALLINELLCLHTCTRGQLFI